MNEGTILFFLAGILIVLAGVVLYRQMVLVRGIRKSLRQAAENISEILAADSDEKIMAFTDDKALMELYGQINRLLLDRQKVKTDYKRQEIASKKMLANIEKDFKEIESLGIDLLFEYATTIEHLKSISDDDFETLKDTIIKVDLVS